MTTIHASQKSGVCVYIKGHRLHSTGATPNNHRQQRTYPTAATIDTIDSERPVYTNKGNNKITELRTILQRESQKVKKYLNRQNQSTTGKLKTVMTLTLPVRFHFIYTSFDLT